MYKGRAGGAEEDRTPDLGISKLNLKLAGTISQSLTHIDPARM